MQLGLALGGTELLDPRERELVSGVAVPLGDDRPVEVQAVRLAAEVGERPAVAIDLFIDRISSTRARRPSRVLRRKAEAPLPNRSKRLRRSTISGMSTPTRRNVTFFPGMRTTALPPTTRRTSATRTGADDWDWHSVWARARARKSRGAGSHLGEPGGMCRVGTRNGRKGPSEPILPGF
jgi:hypothetical protein